MPERIVVYTIARDEERNVNAFMDSAAEADAVYVGVDARTTDRTRELLTERGAHVIDLDIEPWDFSRARNAVLDALPSDTEICVAFDLDEVMSPGWRRAAEVAWKPGVTHLRYPYVYAWKDKACREPGLVIQGYRIHGRHDYVWQNAIHENLKALGEEKSAYVDTFTLYHYPDLDKKRSYLEIIDAAIAADPGNSWMRYVCARENFTGKNYGECIEDCQRYLDMTRAYGEAMVCETRAECCRMIARCYFFVSKEDRGEKVTWMLRAVAENPNERENWVYLAEAWLMFGNPLSALAAFENAIRIRDRLYAAQCEERCWDDDYVARMITELRDKIGMPLNQEAPA